MTHRQILDWAGNKLTEAGITEVKNDAFVLWQEVFGLNRTGYLINADNNADSNLIPKFQMLINLRCTRMPLQYITGKAYFMGLEFKVTPDVLIPRYDTEILVLNALDSITENSRVLDMCTGSGCIGISIAAKKKCMVTAVDVSKAALEIAAHNATSNNVCVEFIESDMFQNVQGEYDVIVSNPPYIPSLDILTLMPEVLEHEPKLALDGSGDGLHFYRILAENSKDYLAADGMLIMEIGYNQAEDVSALLANNNFTDIRVIKDLAGLDRVVCGRRQ